MAGVTSPFLAWLFPQQEKIIPPHNTSDLWVIGNNYTGNNSFFHTQWVQCSYTISGGYGPTPRYIYYALLVLSVVARKVSWLTITALASVMIYSSTAAIHAVALAVLRHKLAPNIFFDHDNWEIILAEGTPFYSNGAISLPGRPTELWLPVLPMAWDNDIDPVLAIVGAAFFTVLLMQNWSTTLRDAEPAARIIFLAWSIIFLLPGAISALITEAYVELWAFPQLRFCPPGSADSLPLMNSGPYTYAGKWDPGDWYRWNRTARDYFVTKNTTDTWPNTCLYPCFEFDWPLRDPSDITVVPGDYGRVTEGNVGYSMLLATFLLVSTSAISSITLLVIAKFSRFDELKDIHLHKLFAKIRAAWKSPNKFRPREIARLGLLVWVFTVDLYAFVLSVPAILFFIGYMEFLMWRGDPGGETFRHVGQWGSLVATVLVLAVAVLQFLIPTIVALYRVLSRCNMLGYLVSSSK